MKTPVQFNRPDPQVREKVDYIKRFQKVGGDIGREGRRPKGDMSYENSEKSEELSIGVTNRNYDQYKNNFESEVKRLGLNFVDINDASYADGKGG